MKNNLFSSSETLNIDFDTDFVGKSIVEVGPGPWVSVF